MKKDFIQEEIERILNGAAREGVVLYEGEIEKLSYLISSLVKCELGTRILFYEKMNDINKIIERHLEQQKKDILDQLLGNTKKETWH